MYSVSSKLYDEATALICQAADGRGYLSDAFGFEYGDVACRLSLSVLLYYTEVDFPEGRRRLLCDAVPVWWEFHTTTPERELLNDFSFSEVRKRLQQSCR